MKHIESGKEIRDLFFAFVSLLRVDLSFHPLSPHIASPIGLFHLIVLSCKNTREIVARNFFLYPCKRYI